MWGLPVLYSKLKKRGEMHLHQEIYLKKPPNEGKKFFFFTSKISRRNNNVELTLGIWGNVELTSEIELYFPKFSLTAL